MDRGKHKKTQWQPEESELDPTKLLEVVRREMSGTGYAELSRVRCEFAAGQIVLRGTLQSYHLKQVALHSAVRAARPVGVDNRIEVAPPKPRQLSGNIVV